MHTATTALPGVLLLHTARFSDARGHFDEVYRSDSPPHMQLCRVAVSHNVHRGTVRGLHLQRSPHGVTKLVRVTCGAVLDVVVDVDPASPNHGKHVAVELSRDNGLGLWIPAGYAHGFCTLLPGTDVLYHLSRDYAPEHQAGVRWDDPALQIPWPVSAEQAVLSDRDRALPLLHQL